MLGWSNDKREGYYSYYFYILSFIIIDWLIDAFMYYRLFKNNLIQIVYYISHSPSLLLCTSPSAIWILLIKSSSIYLSISDIFRKDNWFLIVTHYLRTKQLSLPIPLLLENFLLSSFLFFKFPLPSKIESDLNSRGSNSPFEQWLQIKRKNC